MLLRHSPPQVSSGASLLLQAASEASLPLDSTQQQAIAPPQPFPNEPNLYPIPLPASYRRLPVALRLFIDVVAGIVVAWRRYRILLFPPLYTHHIPQWVLHWHPLVRFVGRLLRNWLLQSLVLSCCTRFVLQEAFLGPARLSVHQLQEQYWLPSTLSKYQDGIHFLEYNKGTNGNTTVHVNHGFGASSLSWLPTLPSLATKLQAGCITAHDAPGFGLTQRPQNRTAYTQSAQYGLKVACNPTWLLGHSMGCRTTLEMALQCNASQVVLVAPALAPPQGRLLRVPLAFAVSTPLRYLLRRLVGAPSFWKRALQSTVWGDKQRLEDTDVVRFAWPSLIRGWEDGLLRFSAAQVANRPMAATELIQQVLDQGTTIQVVVGSKDKIVSPKQVRKLIKPFPSICYTELPGLGHDPFEENVEAFVEAIVVD